MNNQKAIASWSGGKDSCMACYQAMKEGYKITHLLNFVSEKYKRCCFHGLEPGFILRQSERIGIPLVQKEVPDDMTAYEASFKEGVQSIKGVKAMVFGDIYLDEHKNWVERVCGDLKIRALEPLWERAAPELVSHFIDLGFKAVIVSAQADKFDRDFVGRVMDHDLVSELLEKKICPCGENGEFHTVVADGPFFQQPLLIKKSRPVLKEGFWKYWFLDIQEFE